MPDHDREIWVTWYSYLDSCFAPPVAGPAWWWQLIAALVLLSLVLHVIVLLILSRRP
jgi:hypothetical protein